LKPKRMGSRKIGGSGCEMFRSRFLYLGPVFLYAGLIFLLSSISRFPESTPSFYGLDKVLHFILYLLFGWLICRWLAADNSFLRQNRFWMTVAIGTLYGFSDEWHQSFVPGREASLWDVFFDGLGVLTAAGIFDRPFARKLCLPNPKESSAEKEAFHEEGRHHD